MVPPCACILFTAIIIFHCRLKRHVLNMARKLRGSYPMSTIDLQVYKIHRVGLKRLHILWRMRIARSFCWRCDDLHCFRAHKRMFSRTQAEASPHQHIFSGKAKKETKAEKRLRIQRQAKAKERCLKCWLPAFGISSLALILIIFLWESLWLINWPCRAHAEMHMCHYK